MKKKQIEKMLMVLLHAAAHPTSTCLMPTLVASSACSARVRAWLEGETVGGVGE
jgi:hypothetical protein